MILRIEFLREKEKKVKKSKAFLPHSRESLMLTTVDQPHLAYIAVEWRIRNKDLRERERERERGKEKLSFSGALRREVF